MIAWIVEDSADRVFVLNRRNVIKAAKERAKKRGLPQFGYKLRVASPTQTTLSTYLNGRPKEQAREEVITVEPSE